MIETATTSTPEAAHAPASPAAAPGAGVNVCMLAYTFYPNDARVRREAETLASEGFRVRCLTISSTGAPSTFTLDGVEVRELGIPKYRGKSRAAYAASYFRFLLASSLACIGLLWRGELDVLHVHNVPDFLVFAGLVPRLAGVRVVLDVHDSVPETFATKFSDATVTWKALCLEERLSAAVAHRVICVNAPQRDALVARGIPAGKTFISMNVPDPRIFGASPHLQAAEPSSDFDLVYHGTMAERLGVDLVIRAVAQLRPRVPCVRLNLWGHGDDLSGFQALARELGVDDIVRFRPQGYRLEELPGRLAAMKVGVVGNRRSVAGDLMLPVKLLEYVSLGIPAIVPRLQTIAHYFTDDMVTYFEPEDVDSLSAAMHRLYSEPELGRRQALRARSFLAEYGWERQGGELVGFYQQLLDGARAGARGMSTGVERTENTRV